MNTNDLNKQVWALEAYANSVKILTHSKTSKDLIEGVCSEITNQYPYVIAWVGIAESDAEKSVKVIGVSGKAKAYAKGLGDSLA